MVMFLFFFMFTIILSTMHSLNLEVISSPNEDCIQDICDLSSSPEIQRIAPELLPYLYQLTVDLLTVLYFRQ